MISRFCIDRPIFAAVLSIVITLAGAVAVFTLPISQYPNVTPPTVVVSASYPGANAEIVRDTVAAPIEQQVNGVEGMLDMSSVCTNDGAYELTITFELGTDPEMSQVLVQNRVSLALPMIPDLVQKQGVSVKKKSPSTLMIVNLVSTDDPTTGTPRYDALYLGNYATVQVRDELARVPGVGDVAYIGQRDYSMRVWLDPERMASLGVTSGDVVHAIEDQNVQVAAGQIGAPPAPSGQQFQLTVATPGRLVRVEEFANIIVKVRETTEAATVGLVRLSDLGRVELGAREYGQSCTLDGRPSVALTVFQLPGSNAVRTAADVRSKMKDLSERFPEGIEYQIVYDTTPFVRESLLEVLLTFRDALLLVAFVILLFLQSWRATLIPLVAVPVAVIGTFAVMRGIGFGLNTLSLFGLVLAIGIVVDDAIVVVENVQRWLEQGAAPREAARRAMDEVAGPVVAVALVLAAVFVPCAFLPGIVGEFFRQFAITIAVSTAISAFNSLTLSPALAALLLRPRSAGRDPLTWLLDTTLGWLFRIFNGVFLFGTGAYVASVRVLLRVGLLVLVVFGGLVFVTYRVFDRVPVGFVPQQDKGYLLVNVELPEGAALPRTERAMSRIERAARRVPGVAHTLSVSGRSLLLGANASSFASMYVILSPFEQRRGPSQSAEGIAAALRKEFSVDSRNGVVRVFGAPPIEGIGITADLRLVVEDREDLGHAELVRITDEFVNEGKRSTMLADLFAGTSMDAPWVTLEIDRAKCEALGVAIADVSNALEVFLGSYYVDNFNEFGRTWQVNVMAESGFRDRVDQVQRLQVRNEQGEMVVLGTMLRVRETTGPVVVRRHDMYSAATIDGRAARGISSAQAMASMEQIADRSLPPGAAYQWTGLAFLQQRAGNTALVTFGLAILFVFLVLAALYESWLLPLAVILVAPLCLFSSIVGVLLDHLDVNVFTQIGFVVLVGLACKNAILIVEFARQRQGDGAERREATLDACRIRLRPILMTSLAFILGVVPLMLASGAGAEMRRTMGTAVFAGMLGVTAFGIFLTPVFYDLLARFVGPPSSSSGGDGTTPENR